MKRLLALFFLIRLCAPLTAQDAPAPTIKVRQSVDPAAGVVIGQHVAVYVDVMFPGAMPHPPRVSLPDAPGLQIFRFETQGTTMRESVAGEPTVGQRFEFALYARRGGTFDIPPATVTLLDREGRETGVAQGQATHLEVSVPAGVDASRPVVATRRLSLSEQWDPPPASRFKAGDAVVRTIVRSAEDVPGLAMRDLAFPAPEGVRAYADPPDIEERRDRGVLSGRRTDRVTYVFEREGRFELPAVAQPWWDLDARSLRTAEAAAASVQVAASAVASGGVARRWSAGSLAWLALSFGGLAVVIFVARALLRRARASRADPEKAAFAALREACAAGEAEEIYRRFSQWALRAPPASRRAADLEAAKLRAALFSGGARQWTRDDAARLLARLETVRPCGRRARPPSALPALNPASSCSSPQDA